MWCPAIWCRKWTLGFYDWLSLIRDVIFPTGGRHWMGLRVYLGKLEKNLNIQAFAGLFTCAIHELW
jgi:hypothetical protein